MSNIATDPVSCPVCRSTRMRRPFGIATPFTECVECGLLFQPGAVDAEGQTRLYEDDASNASAQRILSEEASRGPYHRELVRRMAREIPEDGGILEIGCGPGGLLAEFQRLGYSIEGVEPSRRLREAAIDRLREPAGIHGLRLEEAGPVLEGKPYAAVVAIDVLEHLADPESLPRLARSWLAPGGRLFLQTPNAASIRRYLQKERWEQLAPEEHLFLHTGASLDRLLDRMGFTDIRIRTVSGSGADSLFRRGVIRPVGALLAFLGRGNGLWASARKDDS